MKKIILFTIIISLSFSCCINAQKEHVKDINGIKSKTSHYTDSTRMDSFIFDAIRVLNSLNVTKNMKKYVNKCNGRIVKTSYLTYGTVYINKKKYLNSAVLLFVNSASV